MSSVGSDKIKFINQYCRYNHKFKIIDIILSNEVLLIAYFLDNKVSLLFHIFYTYQHYFVNGPVINYYSDYVVKLSLNYQIML